MFFDWGCLHNIDVNITDLKQILLEEFVVKI